MALYVDSAFLDHITMAAETVPLTVAPQVLLDMLSDPLSEEAVTRFNQDWQTMNKL